MSDSSALVATWDLGEGETTVPSLQVYMPDASRLTVEARFRLTFDGEAVTWTQGPWTPDPSEVLVEALAVPDEGLWDPEQEARLSSLTVEIWAWQGTALHRVEGGPSLRVAFPYGIDLPVFLDETRRIALAPGGVLADHADAARLGAWEAVVRLEE